MEINHETLIKLGFTELLNRPQRYTYKGVLGRLIPAEGIFYFYGFSQSIRAVDDLIFVMMVIDYQENTALNGYQLNYN